MANRKCPVCLTHLIMRDFSLCSWHCLQTLIGQFALVRLVRAES